MHIVHESRQTTVFWGPFDSQPEVYHMYLGPFDPQPSPKPLGSKWQLSAGNQRVSLCDPLHYLPFPINQCMFPALYSPQRRTR